MMPRLHLAGATCLSEIISFASQQNPQLQKLGVLYILFSCVIDGQRCAPTTHWLVARELR